MEITILAFNYGYAGRFVNGPGMCLVNFVKFLNKIYPEIKVNIFTILKPTGDKWAPALSISNSKALSRAILSSDILHVWSGMSHGIPRAINFANSLNKKIIIGPNVLDTVELEKERFFLKKIGYDKILAVNERLSFRIAKEHKINLKDISVYQVGPDPDLWRPLEETDGSILWKGNSKQFVKNIHFAKKIEQRLKGKYEFKYIGYPRPYNYFEHIEDAKRSKLLIVTSLSETMGLAMAEAWQSGVPSVSHPKIYLHGENYKTGIITSYDVDSYVQAINEIMTDDRLYNHLSNGAIKYMEDNFSPSVIINNYMEILNEQKIPHPY